MRTSFARISSNARRIGQDASRAQKNLFVQLEDEGARDVPDVTNEVCCMDDQDGCIVKPQDDSQDGGLLATMDSTEQDIATSKTAEGEAVDSNPWQDGGRREKRFYGKKDLRAIILDLPACDDTIQSLHWRTPCVKIGSASPSSFDSSPPKGIATHSRLPRANETRRGIKLSEIKKGLIIQWVDTRECNNPHESENNGTVFEDPAGQKFIQKLRYGIVTNRYAYHMDVCPLYSHQNTGVEHQPHDLRDEHVSVRPYGIDAKEFEVLTKHECLDIEKLYGEDELRETSVAKFTETHHFDFDQKARMVGKLTAQSVTRLEKLRRDWREKYA